MQNKIFIPVFIAAVFILGGLLYIFNPEPVEYKNPSEKELIACTMEAKLCPDGSYVSRTGPNCEFAPCPAEALCKGGPCPNQNATSTGN